MSGACGTVVTHLSTTRKRRSNNSPKNILYQGILKYHDDEKTTIKKLILLHKQLKIKNKIKKLSLLKIIF
jgi:hypothetical protein